MKKFFSLLVFVCVFFSLSPPLSAEETKFAYKTFRGVSHIHTQYSHDSTAPLSLVYDSARSNGFDFAVVTDHNSLKGREALAQFNFSKPPLIIFGNEVTTADGHLILLGASQEPLPISTQDLVDWVHAQGGYAFLAHPFTERHPWTNWAIERWDGLEMYGFGHQLLDGDVVGFAIDSFFGSSDDLLTPYQIIEPGHLSRVDELLKKRRVALIAGTDAHQQKLPRQFTLAMKSVSLYCLAKELTEPGIVQAMGKGRCFVAFDTKQVVSNFSYQAKLGQRIFQMGQTLPAGPNVSLEVRLPEAAQVRLVRDGAVVAEEVTAELNFPAAEPGAYRVEVFREENPWIYTNPIYLKAAA